MIAKVVRGWRPGGLVAYLFGPGQHEKHRNPRVVASWDGAPWLHQPDKLAPVVVGGEVVEPGEFDFDLRVLIATMQDPARDAGLPVHTPPPMTAVWAELLRSGRGLPPGAPGWLRWYRYDPAAKAVVLRPGYVWHCPVRLHPDDPVLSDEQWQRIAQRLMEATGIAQAGCRWIAVRHAEDHVHLVATLVDERTGKRVHPYRDYPKLRAACQALEREFGLVGTAPADRTAAPAPTRAEQAKAQRRHRPLTVREELRRMVGQCAATAASGEEFLARLHRDGLAPAVVHDAGGRVCGYTVALPGDRNADGQPVRYSGRALAPDLTWPQLTRRWANLQPVGPMERTPLGLVAPPERDAVLADTTAAVQRATSLIREDAAGGAEVNGLGPAPGDGAGVDGIAHAAGEVLTAMSRAQHGAAPGPLAAVARRFDRAARTPHLVVPVDLGAVTWELRHAARRLGAVGALSGRGQERLASIALLVALGSLIAEIGAWHQLRHRPHQAAAARAAAAALPQLAATMAAPAPAARPARPAATLLAEARPARHPASDPAVPRSRRPG